jgi:hypothetical protein
MTPFKEAMLLIFSVLFLGAISAQADWVGTGTCCVTCCAAGSCASSCGSGSESFATQSDCLSRLAQGTGVCQAYIGAGCTVDSFTPGMCTSTGGSSGGSGSGTSLGTFFENPAVQEALPGFAGNTPTAGIGGLSQGFGTNNKVAPEQGEASFTKHANSSNESWLREAAARLRVHSATQLREVTGQSRSLSGAERAAQFFTAWISPSKTIVSPLTGDSVPRESADYQANYIGGVVIPTVDPANPPVNEIKGGGQPITGAGASVGAKDTPPPPSPETPNVPQVQGRVQTGASVCRDPNWLFNSQTQMCYPSMKSCTAADSQGVCR